MTSPLRRLRELPTHEQPTERLFAIGPQALSDAELLAVLLNTDSLDVCHELLLRCDGWHGVRSQVLTDHRALGLSKRRAALLIAVAEVHRRLCLPSEETRLQIGCPKDVVPYINATIGHADQEHLLTLVLDNKNRLMTTHTVYVGSVNSALIRIAEVFKEALRRNAASIMLAHNHPSADPTPSPDDILVTRQIVEAGELLDVQVIDHIITGPRGKWVSLREQGLGFPK
jgi:DNA repair protein RadC